jgi:molecular chaperone GrpE
MSDTLPEPSANPGDLPPPRPTGTDSLMAEAAERIRALEVEVQDLRDRWMRAEADMQNLRNRTKREVDEARLFAVQKFARDVVEMAENLRRGIDNIPKPQANEPDIVARLREGFEGVERSFVGVLERNGILPEDPLGKMFDANLHQAMGEQPSDQHPPGTVLQAWSRGWTLNGRLLRPAMVVVAKGTPQSLGSPPFGSAPKPAVDTTA